MNQTCRDCQHFYQHYVVNQYQCIRVNFGHCARSDVRACSPDEEACIYFEQRSEDHQTPTDIRFITEELIQHQSETLL